MSSLNLSEVKIKINTIKMLRDRGYDISEEAFCLEWQPEKLHQYYEQKNHLVTSVEETRVFYDPQSLPDNIPLILYPGQIPDEKHENNYVNFFTFIEQSISIGKRVSELRTSLSNVYRHKETGELLLIYFASPPANGKNMTFGESEFRAIMCITEICKIYNLVIVTKYKPTPSVNAKIYDARHISKITVNEPFRTIQLFHDEEFIFCILEHVYACKYRLSSESEFKKSYCGAKSSSRIGKMTSEDAFVRYYGWKIGDIIFEEISVSDGALIMNDFSFKKVYEAPKEKKTKK